MSFQNKFNLFVFFLLIILPSIGQNIKVISETEFISLRTELLNPDNILGENNFNQVNIAKFDYLFRKRSSSLFLDIKISSDYSRIRRDQLGLNNIQKGSFSFDPIEIYYKTYKGNWTFYAGRKKVRFGVGYVASPTDIISLPTQFDDSNDRLFRVLGNELVQASFTGSSWQSDIYILPETDQNTRIYYDNHSIATRIYKYFEAVDLGLLGRLDLSGNYQIGINSTYTIGQKIELHTEATLQNRNNVLYPINGQFLKKSNTPLRLLIGGQWSPSANLNFILEYFHLSQGFNKKEWDDLFNEIQNARLTFQSSLPELRLQGVGGLRTINKLKFFPSRKNYLFFRVFKNKIRKSFKLEYLTFIGIDEFAALHRAALIYKPNSKFKFYTHFQFVTTIQNNSFATLNYKNILRFGLNYNFSLTKK